MNESIPDYRFFSHLHTPCFYPEAPEDFNMSEVLNITAKKYRPVVVTEPNPNGPGYIAHSYSNKDDANNHRNPNRLMSVFSRDGWRRWCKEHNFVLRAYRKPNKVSV